MLRSFALTMLTAALLLAFPSVAAPKAADTPFAQEYHEAYPIVEEGDANDVQCVAVDGKGAVWAGTKAGVYVLPKGAGEWQPVLDEEQAGPAFDMAVDSFGAVWVAAWNGLWRSSADGLARIADIEGPIGAVCVARKGVICLGPSGLWHVRKGKVTRESIDCAGSFRALAEDPSGDLWIATGNGLYHKTDQGLKRYLQPNEVITAMTRDLAYATDGRLWVGGLGGVTVYKGASPVQRITPKEGLPRIYVQSVGVAPDGVMWVGMDQGVVRFDGRSWSYRHSRRWLLDDNVRDVAFEEDGTAWVATAKGVSAIKRKKMTLADKAAYFQEVTETRHTREPGFVEGCFLDVPGDVTSFKPRDDDNDGQYSSMYVVMESYRYAVTKSPEALANAKRTFEALRHLQTVTETDGFVARTVVPVAWGRMADPNREIPERDWARNLIANPRARRVEQIWHPTPDGKWLWKATTSSDEMTGHMYAYLFYHDLVADEAERKVVRDHVCKIMDYIIKHGYVFMDVDGKHTQWGVWAPERLNGDHDWAAERGINSVEILSYLKLAYHVSGDEKYQREYLSLLNDHNYRENVRNSKTYQRMWRTHIDDELLALAYPCLLIHEKDPELKRLYLESLDHWYIGAQEDQCPFFNFIYASLSGKDAHLDESMAYLRDSPLDLINWKVDNSQREDLELVRAPEIEPLQTSRILPPSEVGIMRWDKNPWEAVKGDGGHTEWSATYWLLPYWMGRYYGYIGAPR